MIGEPIISVIMVTIRPVDRACKATLKWDIRRQSASRSRACSRASRSACFGLQIQNRLCHEAWVVSVRHDDRHGPGFFRRLQGTALRMARQPRSTSRVAQGRSAFPSQSVFAMGLGNLGERCQRSPASVVAVGERWCRPGPCGLRPSRCFPAAILGGLDFRRAAAVLGGHHHRACSRNIRAIWSTASYLHWGKSLRDSRPFYVLIIVLMIKPYGLFGTHDIERI